MENQLLDEPTETDLLHQAKGGDFAAFQQLVAKLQPRVYGLTFRILQQAQDAEDATQQTFLLRARLALRERLTRKFGDVSQAMTPDHKHS